MLLLGGRPLMLALAVCFSLLAPAVWAQTVAPQVERNGSGERITSHELTHAVEAPVVNEAEATPAPAKVEEARKEPVASKEEATKEPATLTSEQQVEQLMAKGASKEKAEAMVAEAARQAEQERTGAAEGSEPGFAPVSNADGDLINTENPKH